MTRVEKLRQMGLSFDQQPSPGCEVLALQEQCKNIYRAAFDRVSARADLVDRRRACAPVPRPDPMLSDTFRAKDRELSKTIEAEWLAKHPDLEKFKRLVVEWERLCMKELEA